MKATINNDPMVRRQLRGKRIARGISFTALGIFLGTAWLCPDLFSNELNMPTAEEREKAKRERKNKAEKRPRVLSEEDIERLAKLRKNRYRKQLVESITKLEARVIVAEQLEAEATARFRNDPNTLPSLKALIPSHARLSSDALIKEYRAAPTGTNAFHHPQWRTIGDTVPSLQIAASQLDSPEAQKAAAQAAEKLNEAVVTMNWGSEETPDGFSTEALRLTRTLEGNTKALATNDVELALRGHASADDHPLTPPQRADLAQTLRPMAIAELHQLSQKLAGHYSDLIGDVRAADLADVAGITFPEALDKIAHESYLQDDLADSLDGIESQSPDGDAALQDMTDALNDAAASAARALMESTPESEGGT